ncbi:hypothetical protein ACEQUB_03142 [Ralstonia syzygii]
MLMRYHSTGLPQFGNPDGVKMAKKIVGFIKLQIPACKANPPRPSARPWVSAV